MATASSAATMTIAPAEVERPAPASVIMARPTSSPSHTAASSGTAPRGDDERIRPFYQPDGPRTGGSEPPVAAAAAAAVPAGRAVALAVAVHQAVLAGVDGRLAHEVLVLLDHGFGGVLETDRPRQEGLVIVQLEPLGHDPEHLAL